MNLQKILVNSCPRRRVNCGFMLVVKHVISGFKPPLAPSITIRDNWYLRVNYLKVQIDYIMSYFWL